jgi:sugar lactone lactonase YvrE
MGVDACDNVYAIEAARRVVRFSPDGGEPETLFEVPAGAWMTNLQWGSGVGGWGSRMLYVTDRSRAAPVYYEVPLGVPSKP